MWTRIAILASIGGLIGWLTNILAIKLIFRPIEPIGIPIIGYQFQGLIPKRRNELANSVGETIERELISIEEVLERMLENHDKSELIDTIQFKINEVVSRKMPTFLPKSIKELIMTYVQDITDREIEPAIDEIITKIVNKTTQSVKIGEMVEQKINELDLEQLEKIVIDIAKKELKQIERLGGVLGFLIGIIQGIIIIYI